VILAVVADVSLVFCFLLSLPKAGPHLLYSTIPSFRNERRSQCWPFKGWIKLAKITLIVFVKLVLLHQKVSLSEFGRVMWVSSNLVYGLQSM